MKSAQEAAKKFVARASVASGDYVTGAAGTSKDQNALAIAAADRYKQGVNEAIAKGRFEKGLRASSRADWLQGVRTKGEARFAEGVSAAEAKYATNSARYDVARGAANNLPRGVRGSEMNYTRSKVVGQALRAVKVGSAA